MTSFFIRLGALLCMPRKALSTQLGSTPRGTHDLLFVGLFVVAILRLPQLIRTVWLALDVGLTASLIALLNTVADVAKPALAAWLIGAGALWLVSWRRQQDATNRLELAAACLIGPLSLVTLLRAARIAWPVLGLGWLPRIPQGLAALWYVALLVVAAQLLRRNPEASTTDASQPSPSSYPPSHPQLARSVRYWGMALVFSLGLAIAGQAWIAAHALETLRPPAAGRLAPNIQLPRPDGSTLSLSALRGSVVVLEFWASWCPPCRASFPMLERLQKQLGAKGVRVVAVNIEGDVQKVQTFLAARQTAEQLATKTSLLDVVIDDGSAAALYSVETIPHLVLLDRTGHIRAVHIGGASEAELRNQVLAELQRTKH